MIKVEFSVWVSGIRIIISDVKYYNTSVDGVFKQLVLKSKIIKEKYSKYCYPPVKDKFTTKNYYQNSRNIFREG